MTDEPRLGWAAIIALLAAVFVLDLATPIGIADGMLYGFVIVFQAHFCRVDRSLVVAAASTALIILGFLGSGEAPDATAAIVNRAFSIGLAWSIAAVTAARSVVERVHLPQLRHDAEKPAHSVLNYSELLLQGRCGSCEDERSREYLHAIHKAAQDMSDTVDGLIRLVGGRLPVFAKELMLRRRE